MVTIGEVYDLDEGHVLTTDNAKLQINQSDTKTGKLVLLQSALVFVLQNSNQGITIPWPRIGLHAIQNTNGVRKIYFMTEVEITWPGVYENHVHNNGRNAEEDDEGHESDGSDERVTEFWVEPTSNDEVDLIFNAMKQCQSLHPDPHDSVSDDEDFMDADDTEDGDGAGQMRNLNIDDDRFADAEEDDE